MFASVGRMPLQRSFEELGDPLADVTFCVIDLETTGGSPGDHAITEIGALKVRRGETLGTLHTLVNPGRPVPAFIRLLTGITDNMLIEAPGIEAVLPSLLEFLHGTVLVAHNARFDVGFLDAALERAGYDPLKNQVVDTARLARKILSGEVPNHRLETLARHLRCAHQPCHRAFADVLATVDVLHHLIERVAGYGVTTLQDLVSITRVRLDGNFRKIRLTEELPNGPGVYRFLGNSGNTLYVGKATDVRARVRSYFYGDTRSRIRDLLRETDRIEAAEYGSLLEAEIAEARAIGNERPPYNRVGKRGGLWFLKLTLEGRSPKVRPARVVKDDDGNLYLGPFRSRRLVTTLIEALQDAVPLHRCAEPASCRGCAFGEMGVCEPQERAAIVRDLAAAVHSDHQRLLGPLRAKMVRLARAGRFEQAADVRDRSAALARALAAFAGLESLRRAGSIVVQDGRRALYFEQGAFVAGQDIGEGDDRTAVEELLARRSEAADVDHSGRDARVLLAYLRRAGSMRVLYSSGTWALPLGCRPDDGFEVAS